EDTVKTVWSNIHGEQRFYGIFDIDQDLTNLQAHQSLLAAYQKLQTAKRLA
ncbi:MAG: hypothetical protein KBE15_05950, partial [Budvicia sp.]|nr:hypothetical protein [Budvicia sp.]